MGKSSIVAEILDRLRIDQRYSKEFPDGVIVCDFKGISSPHQALQRIPPLYGIEIKPNETVEFATQKVLEDKHALIVLDGLDMAEDWEAIQNVVKDSSCGILITTRLQDKFSTRTSIFLYRNCL
jgi:hypothetical protein